MTTHSQSKKSKNQKLLTTTHRHQMIENHMIEFDHEFDSDDEEIIENLIDENVPDCRNPLPFQSSTASEVSKILCFQFYLNYSLLSIRIVPESKSQTMLAHQLR